MWKLFDYTGFDKFYAGSPTMCQILCAHSRIISLSLANTCVWLARYGFLLIFYCHRITDVLDVVSFMPLLTQVSFGACRGRKLKISWLTQFCM